MDPLAGRCHAPAQAHESVFLAELQDAFGYRLGALQQVGARHLYPLTLIEAEEQVRSGLVVLGNAAHSLHPIAGQGYNLSLRDVDALSAALLRSEAPLGDLALLQEYARRQRFDQRLTVGFSDRVTRLFGDSGRLVATGRNLGLLGTDLAPWPNAGSRAGHGPRHTCRLTAPYPRAPAWMGRAGAQGAISALGLELLPAVPRRRGAGATYQRRPAPGRVKMVLRWYNRNYVGTQFGGSLYSMVDPFFVLMLMENLGRTTSSGTRRPTSNSSARAGAVYADFSISQQLLDEIRMRTADGSKYLPRMHVEVRDGDGTLVARVQKTLYIRLKPRAAGRRQLMQADLIIVGAGMVGSTLALALEGSGLDIPVLDASPLEAADFDPQGGFEPRVSALSAASQRIFERLGAWPGMSARRVGPYTDMHVWDGSGTGQIHFSAETVHAEVLGHIVENRVVQDALLETMQRRGGQRLLGAARLERLSVRHKAGN